MITALYNPTSTTRRVSKKAKKRTGKSRRMMDMERTPIAYAGNALPTVTWLAKAIPIFMRKAIAMAKTWRTPCVHLWGAPMSMNAWETLMQIVVSHARLRITQASLLKKSLQVIKIIAVFLIRTAYAYRLQLLMILRQGVLPTIRMWISVCRMMTAVQRVVFRKNRLRMIAMERVPQLTVSRNAQKITTAVRQDPTHMASTTKIHGRVLEVIAPPSTLLWDWVRQDPHRKTAIALLLQGTCRKRSDMNVVKQAQICTRPWGEVSPTATKPMVIFMTTIMTVSTARPTRTALSHPTPQGRPPQNWSASLVL